MPRHLSASFCVSLRISDSLCLCISVSLPHSPSPFPVKPCPFLLPFTLSSAQPSGQLRVYPVRPRAQALSCVRGRQHLLSDSQTQSTSLSEADYLSKPAFHQSLRMMHSAGWQFYVSVALKFILGPRVSGHQNRIVIFNESRESFPRAWLLDTSGFIVSAQVIWGPDTMYQCKLYTRGRRRVQVEFPWGNAGEPLTQQQRSDNQQNHPLLEQTQEELY